MHWDFPEISLLGLGFGRKSGWEMGFGQNLGWEMGFGQNLGWEMGFIPPFQDPPFRFICASWHGQASNRRPGS